jgi:phage gpG-like protein
MSDIEISFKKWAPFKAQKDQKAFRRWLKVVAEESYKAFTTGMKQYPPASKKGQYPSIRTGRLRRSVATRVTDDTVVIGTHMPYSGYLRHGTRKMARRKMSDNALKEGIAAATKRAEKWVGWSHGSP